MIKIKDWVVAIFIADFMTVPVISLLTIDYSSKEKLSVIAYLTFWMLIWEVYVYIRKQQESK